MLIAISLINMIMGLLVIFNLLYKKKNIIKAITLGIAIACCIANGILLSLHYFVF